MGEGEPDMDWTERRVLPSDVGPMGIRPSWTAVGAATAANDYWDLIHRLVALSDNGWTA